MKEENSTVGRELTEAAIYLRLSSADGPAAESDSIQNQRSFLQEWAREQGFCIVREFVDDGHTGTDFAGVR